MHSNISRTSSNLNFARDRMWQVALQQFGGDLPQAVSQYVSRIRGDLEGMIRQEPYLVFLIAEQARYDVAGVVREVQRDSEQYRQWNEAQRVQQEQERAKTAVPRFVDLLIELSQERNEFVQSLVKPVMNQHQRADFERQSERAQIVQAASRIFQQNNAELDRQRHVADFDHFSALLAYLRQHHFEALARLNAYINEEQPQRFEQQWLPAALENMHQAAMNAKKGGSNFQSLQDIAVADYDFGWLYQLFMLIRSGANVYLHLTDPNHSFLAPTKSVTSETIRFITPFVTVNHQSSRDFADDSQYIIDLFGFYGAVETRHAWLYTKIIQARGAIHQKGMVEKARELERGKEVAEMIENGTYEDSVTYQDQVDRDLKKMETYVEEATKRAQGQENALDGIAAEPPPPPSAQEVIEKKVAKGDLAVDPSGELIPLSDGVASTSPTVKTTVDGGASSGLKGQFKALLHDPKQLALLLVLVGGWMYYMFLRKK